MSSGPEPASAGAASRLEAVQEARPTTRMSSPGAADPGSPFPGDASSTMCGQPGRRPAVARLRWNDEGPPARGRVSVGERSMAVTTAIVLMALSTVSTLSGRVNAENGGIAMRQAGRYPQPMPRRPEDRAFPVSEITPLIKGTLEEGFPEVLVEGEVSNCRPSSSGHLYFSLKDRDAVLSAVMFRHRFQGLGLRVADGLL